MGTTYQVKVVLSQPPPTTNYSQQLQKKVDSFLVDFNRIFSTYDQSSEISLINHNVQKEAGILVSPEFQAGVKQALVLSDFTQGKFDPSISPLVNLWGFGYPKKKRNDLPSDDEINRVKKLVDYRKIIFQDNRFFLATGMMIDLSAIAKGKAVDQIGKILEEENIENYLVEIGGELQARGKNKNDQKWKVSIASPDSHLFDQVVVIEIENQAVATSGDYHHYFEHEGRRYSHIIDPITGYPIRHRLASVSVIADTCEEADALATALFVMGEKQGFDFAKKNNLASYFIFKQGEGFSVKMTERFKSFLKKQ